MQASAWQLECKVEGRGRVVRLHEGHLPPGAGIFAQPHTGGQEAVRYLGMGPSCALVMGNLLRGAGVGNTGRGGILWRGKENHWVITFFFQFLSKTLLRFRKLTAKLKHFWKPLWPFSLFCISTLLKHVKLIVLNEVINVHNKKKNKQRKLVWEKAEKLLTNLSSRVI